MVTKIAASVFPKRHRQLYWRVRGIFGLLRKRNVGLVLKNGIFGKFATSVKLAYKELDSITGRLDYPKADIFMEVESLRGVKRLSACKKEPETVDWIENNVKKGDIFYDIGANVGAYSLVASLLGAGAGKVYAFEPGAATYAVLSRNILLNKVEGKVIPIGLAISDNTALNNLEYSSFTAGEAQHNWGNSAVRNFQPIPSFRLDDFIEIFKIEPPNHIKIDVDGHEMNVLVGATKTLNNPNLKSLLIEIDESVSQSKNIYQLLENAGFSLSSKHFRNSTPTYNCIFIRK